MLSNADEQQHAMQTLMEEQRNVRIVTEQRIASLETRTTVIEGKQTQFDLAMAKLVEVVASQVNKTMLNEAAIVAIKERTDDHNKHIEELQKGQVEQGHLINDHGNKLTIIWRTVATIGGAIALIVVEYLFSHFLPK